MLKLPLVVLQQQVLGNVGAVSCCASAAQVQVALQLLLLALGQARQAKHLQTMSGLLPRSTPLCSSALAWGTRSLAELGALPLLH